MPTYQYACTGCDERLEVVQRFSDDPLTECTVCGSRLRKVFSPVGIVFKGSGFYRTDSRATANGGNGSSSSDEQKAKEPATSAESNSTNKSDSAGESSKSGDSKSSSETKSSGSGGTSDSGGSSGGKRTEKVA